MAIADTIMVGRLGAGAIAAVGLGNVLYFTPAIFGYGMLLGVDYLVAVNPGCLRQWQSGLARRKSRIRAVHLADLLVAAAGGRPLPKGLPPAARLPQVRLPSGQRVRRVFRLRKDAGAQGTSGWSA